MNRIRARFAQNSEKAAYKTLLELSETYEDIRKYLGNAEVTCQETSLDALNDKLYQYISLIDKKGEIEPRSYAVERAIIHVPLKDNLAFEIDDLPGINAPGNRAEKMTWNAVENDADVIIFVKNAASNASLDRDEENVFEKAKASDTSVTFSKRVFVILNKADIQSIHHGRDCHLRAKENLLKEKSVAEDHIFFCSSNAELFDRYEGKDLDFQFSEKEADEAKANIGKYYRTSNPTTGFTEFKNYLYDFINNDLEIIEKRALNDLTVQVQNLKDDVRNLLAQYEKGLSFEKEMTSDEICRFTDLWAPQDAFDRDVNGLGTKIKKTINRDGLASIESEAIARDLVTSVKKTIEDFKNTFISKHVTEERLAEEGYTAHNSALQNESERQRAFLKRIQENLKIEIYRTLGRLTAQNIYQNLAKRWENILQTTDTGSPHGLAAIPEKDRKAFAARFAEQHPDGVLSEFLRSYASDDDEHTLATIRLGFEAIVKSIANAPLEYFFQYAEDLNADYQRLLTKAMVYRDILSDDRIGKTISTYFSQNEKTSQSDIKKFIDNNSGFVCDIISVFLPVSVQLALHAAKKTVEIKQGQEKKEQSYKDILRDALRSANKADEEKKKEAQDPKIQEEKPSFVDQTKIRIDEFFQVLSSMLFDCDFGFVGYYRAIFEEFRLSMVNEVDNGFLVEMARCHRDSIWPGEELFKISNLRKEKMAQIAAIKSLL